MKKIAPIIVTIIVCAWIAVYTAGLFRMLKYESSRFESIMLLSIALVFTGIFFAMIWTLIIRLKEINKEGTDDDISKY